MRYRVANHVAWVSGEDIGVEDGVYVVDVRDGVPLVLRDSAAVIWLIAADGGSLPDDLEVEDAEDRTTVHAEVMTFTAGLVMRGLWEEVE